MSTPLVYTVIVLAAVGAVFCTVQLRRACRTVDDALNPTDDTPPDPDLDAGCDRLWDAITEHRKENEQ